MMTTDYRVTPCVRVLILSITLLTLIAGVVAVGSIGVIRLNHRVDHMAEVDVPRFDHLLHIDRDLFRAQRSMGLAFFATDPAVRSDHIEEFQLEVDNTAARWEKYLAVAEGGEQEVALEADYGTYRAAWLASTRELVALLRMGVVPGDPVATELLEVIGADFFALRTLVHELEEEIAEPHIANTIASIERTGAATVDTLLALFAVGLVAGGVVSFTTFRAVRIQHRRSVRREAQQVIEAVRTAFEPS